jgi:short-subunit dehydrogenase
LRALAREIARAHSVRVEVLPCDLADASARQTLAERVSAFGLRVDMLVNSAGLGSYGAFVELDPAREVEQVRVMCEAVIDLCGMFVPAMAARRCGGVLIVSSALGFQPAAGYATYGAAKAFSLRFGEALHSELVHSSVAVTTLCPGPVNTDFFSVNGPQPVERVIPRRVWRTAHEVAQAAVEGLTRNRRVVIPGTAMRILTASGRVAPRAAQLRFVDMLFRAGATAQ